MKPAYKLVLLVLIAGAAIFLAVRSLMAESDSQNTDPKDTRWLCTSQPCGKDFTLTFAQLGEFYQKYPGANPPCPFCGKSETVRATACPSCGKTIAKHDRQTMRTKDAKGDICPHCGKPIPG